MPGCFQKPFAMTFGAGLGWAVPGRAGPAPGTPLPFSMLN
jgi:hypothetical protein